MNFFGWFLCKIGCHDWEHEMGDGFPPELYRSRCRRCMPPNIRQLIPGIVYVEDERKLE